MDICRVLLKHGAKVDAPAEGGATPLYICCQVKRKKEKERKRERERK